MSRLPRRLLVLLLTAVMSPACTWVSGEPGSSETRQTSNADADTVGPSGPAPGARPASDLAASAAVPPSDDVLLRRTGNGSRTYRIAALPRKWIRVDVVCLGPGSVTVAVYGAWYSTSCNGEKFTRELVAPYRDGTVRVNAHARARWAVVLYLVA